MDVAGSIPDWGTALIAVAAILTAVSYLYRKWLRPLAGMIRATAQSMDTLHEIALEFAPNHGTSLRDTIDRIETKVDTAADKVDEATATLDERTLLFGEMQSAAEQAQQQLAHHMAEDTLLFASAQQALVQGQDSLLQRLGKIEEVLDVLQRGSLKRRDDE